MTGRTIGLIAGLGPEATVHYYRKLLAAHDARGATLSLVMIQADMQRVIQHVRNTERQALAEYFAGLIGSLKSAGAGFAVLPAVTPHICAAALESLSPLPLVDILATTRQAIQAKGYRKVAIFGTRYSIETDLFGALSPITVVRPAASEIDLIHDIYFRLATTGTGTGEDRRLLTELARTLMARDGVEATLLAGTDLSVIFDESNTDFPHVDCAQAQIDAIVRQALGSVSRE